MFLVTDQTVLRWEVCMGWRDEDNTYELAILAASSDFWNLLHYLVSLLKWSQHPLFILKNAFGGSSVLHTCVLVLWKETMLLLKLLPISEEHEFVICLAMKSLPSSCIRALTHVILDCMGPVLINSGSSHSCK